MEITNEERLIRVRIVYDNSSNSDDRDNAFRYLDKAYGVLGYTITRQGPKAGCNGIGLIIAEINQGDSK